LYASALLALMTDEEYNESMVTLNAPVDIPGT
jgi:hypothetical protein